MVPHTDLDPNCDRSILSDSEVLIQKDGKKHKMEIPKRERYVGQFGQNGCAGSCRQLSQKGNSIFVNLAEGMALNH